MCASQKLHLHVRFTHCIIPMIQFCSGSVINIQPHLRVAYKMVWLMVMKMSGLVYTCQY